MSDYILRPYQSQTLDALRQHFAAGNRAGLVNWPTGTGKTVLAAEICRTARRPVLFIAHRGELLEQTEDKIRAFVPDADIGFVKAGRDEHDRQYVLASVQTLARPARLARIAPDRFGVVFLDECHHAAAASYRRVLDHFTGVVIGLSGTPYRLDGRGLDDIFGAKPVYTYEIETAVKDGYLVPPRGWLIQTDADLDAVHTVAGDLNVGELAGVMNTIASNRVTVESWHEHASDCRTIVFAVDVQHAIDLADAFTASGIAADYVHGKMNDTERRERLERFRAGDIQVLANCMILTEGFDESAVGCVIMARPTKSKSLYIQCVGRGLRPADGKKDCIILDIVGVTKRHSLRGVGDLFGFEQRDMGGMTPDEFQAAERERRRIQSEADFFDSTKVDFFNTSRTEREVIEVFYSSHTKRGAEPGAPRTLKVTYTIAPGNHRISEWLCMEHDGYPHKLASGWWYARTSAPMPDSAEDAVAMAEQGLLATPTHIVIERGVGERYARIVGCELGEKPQHEELSYATACPKCGDYERVMRPGRGPHAAAEVCAHCSRWLRWVSKKEADSMVVAQEV